MISEIWIVTLQFNVVTHGKSSGSSDFLNFGESYFLLVKPLCIGPIVHTHDLYGFTGPNSQFKSH
jgi:hypothetical protein